MSSILKVDQLQDSGGNNLVTSNGSGVITAAGFGKVGQVLSTSKTDTFTTTSNSFVDITGFTVSITPSSTSSKIFVMANLNCSGTAGVTAQYLNLVRDSTDLLKGDAAGSRARVSTANITADNAVSVTSSMSFLDTPSSSSSLVYKVQTASSASGTVYVNRTNSDTDNFTRARGASTITVMEILP